MKRNWLASLQGNFLTGLAVILPAVLSLAIITWLFGTVANFTDRLLFFLPHDLTHAAGGTGPIHWYWSLVALALAVLLVALLGRLTRNYLGRQFVRLVDLAMLRVPLLNKIYGAIKQVNEAIATNSKTAFRTVVMIQYPRAGVYSIGFITSEQHQEAQARTRENVVCVFVPTTPNPTSGFLVLVPEDQITKLDMSVAEGIKYIISLGSVAPEYAARPATVAPA